MHHLARKLAGPLEAEDIAQEVFSYAFRSLDALRDENAFRAWLFGIAARLARRQYQRRTLRAVLLDERAQLTTRNLDDMVHAEATLELKEVSKRIALLRTRERDVIWLHRLEGKTREETAHAMGVSLSSVKRLIARVDQRLKGYSAVGARPYRDSPKYY